MSDRGVLLLPFSEPDGVALSDKIGSLPDFEPAGSLTVPAPVVGAAGFARSFTAGTGLVAASQLTPDPLNLRRDLTIQLLITPDLAAQLAAATPGTILARGANTGAGEYRSWELSIEGVTATRGRLRLGWQEADGAVETPDSALWVSPEGEPVLLTAVRRWRAADLVEIAYYGNGKPIGSSTSTAGDIAGIDGALVTLGCRADESASVFERHLEGVLHSLVVLNYAMTADEVEVAYRRVFEWQLEGYRMVKSLLPEGPYTDDPGSIAQRFFFAAGDVFGAGYAATLETVELALPDKATALLPDWERMTKQPPRPADIIEDRQARVQSFLRTVAGYSEDQVKSALEAVLDLGAEDIEILAGRNLFEESTWAALPAWLQLRIGADEATGTIAVDSGELSMVLSADSNDYKRGNHLMAYRSIDRLDTLGDEDPVAGAYLRARFGTGHGSFGNSILGGLFFEDKITRSIAIIGFGHLGGTAGIYTQFRDTSEGSPAWQTQVLREATASPDDYRIALRYDGAGQFTAWWHDDGEPEAGSSVTLSTNFVPEYCGLVFMEFETTRQDELRYAEASLYFPKSPSPYSWAVYRDPDLPGSPDMEAANRSVRRIRPGHTHASAVSRRRLLCGDPLSLMGRDLMGGE